MPAILKKQMTATDVWKQCRGIENSYRYFSDILIGVMELLPEKGQEELVGLDSKLALHFDGEWPNLCRPPRCRKAREEILAQMREIGERAHHLAALTEVLMTHLPANVDKIEFHPSEIPGTWWPPRKSGPTPL
jgi:hypothetical protein